MTKIKIESLTKKIKGILILDNINLEFESGHIYGIKGINGSGKTMLMRCICGLVLPTSGNIYIDTKLLGKDISFPNNLGALIEKPGLIENESIIDNLKMLASINNKISESDINIFLNMFDLDKVRNKKIKKLSLGMKQKVGIIAAVMEKPDIIILDEPFNALDEKSIIIVKQLILENKRRGALCILSCHNKGELENISDKIFEISEGNIINEYKMEKKSNEKI